MNTYFVITWSSHFYNIGNWPDWIAADKYRRAMFGESDRTLTKEQAQGLLSDMLQELK